ncbi:MAG: Crp/Fnr family transcriptional regulator [Oceanospirillaceae bacterium]|nr:Crp/Fnr family transcriptional regulator [Oceanospirillaceae bacterium]
MSAEVLIDRYGALAELDAEGRELLLQARRVELPADTVIFRHGDSCDHFVMLVSGRIKVMTRSTAGRELLLYRIDQLGTCVLTTSCLLGHQNYPAEGIAETDVVAYLLPRSAFQQAVDNSPALRTFIFDSYAERLAGLIHLVQAVSFENIEQRLSAHLLQRADEEGVVRESHQLIADELGTAREVISRKLQVLAKKNVLVLERGRVTLIDPDALQHSQCD